MARLVLKRGEHHWRISGLRHNGRRYDLSLLLGKLGESVARDRANRLFQCPLPAALPNAVAAPLIDITLVDGRGTRVGPLPQEAEDL